MSAVFGIVNKNGKPVNTESLRVMQSAITHRATDGKDTWMNGIVGFGHCLLKVYPQQEYEHCPLTAYNCTITADARLDNRAELAALLRIDREMLNNTSDPELILLSYKHWGEDCVNHLEGEFAFAIWDADNQKLFAATDHIGFRPFFYYESPEQFIFCSEIKGIVAVKPLPNYFNEESLIEYFYRKGTPNITYNKEVFALCGGNVLTLQDGKMAYRKYWNLESTGKYNFTKDQDWYDCTRELLYRAVEKRLNPDVPTGITLSGGLDSTSVACILSELLMKKNKPLYAFSSVLPLDHRWIEKDERDYIEMVGKHCPNIIQTYVEAPGVGPFSDLEKGFGIEETFPNAFFYMDKALLDAAKQSQIRMLFNGFGGDYWISWHGGNAVYDLMKKANYKKAIEIMRQFSEKKNKSFWQVFKGMYLYKTAYYSFLRFPFKHQNEIERKMLSNDFFEKYKHQIREDAEVGYADSISLLVNRGAIGRKLIRFHNRNGFYNTEGGTPLFDKHLFELLCDIPLYFFVNYGERRSLIRNVMDGLIPDEIRNRSSKGDFSPDYALRLIEQKNIMLSMLSKNENDYLIDYYFDMCSIGESISKLKDYEVFFPASKKVFLYTPCAGISATVIALLKSRGYMFELNR